MEKAALVKSLNTLGGQKKRYVEFINFCIQLAKEKNIKLQKGDSQKFYYYLGDNEEFARNCSSNFGWSYKTSKQRICSMTQQINHLKANSFFTESRGNLPSRRWIIEDLVAPVLNKTNDNKAQYKFYLPPRSSTRFKFLKWCWEKSAENEQLLSFQNNAYFPVPYFILGTSIQIAEQCLNEFDWKNEYAAQAVVHNINRINLQFPSNFAPPFLAVDSGDRALLRCIKADIFQ